MNTEASTLSVGDRVTFQSARGMVEGTVTRIEREIAVVRTRYGNSFQVASTKLIKLPREVDSMSGAQPNTISLTRIISH